MIFPEASSIRAQSHHSRNTILPSNFCFHAFYELKFEKYHPILDSHPKLLPPQQCYSPFAMKGGCDPEHLTEKVVGDVRAEGDSDISTQWRAGCRRHLTKRTHYEIEPLGIGQFLNSVRHRCLHVQDFTRKKQEKQIIDNLDA